MNGRRLTAMVGTVALVLFVGAGMAILDAERHRSAQRAEVEDRLATHAARLQSAVAERVRETRTLSATAAGATPEEIRELVREISARDSALVGGVILRDGVVRSGALPRVPSFVLQALGLREDLVGAEVYDPGRLAPSARTTLEEMVQDGATGIIGPMMVPPLPFEVLFAIQTVPGTAGQELSLLVVDMNQLLADADIDRETELAGRTIRVGLTVDSLGFGDDVADTGVAFGDVPDDAVVVPVLAPDVEWALAGVPVDGWDRWSPATLPVTILALLGAVIAGLLAGNRHDMRAALVTAVSAAEDDARRARRREEVLARHAPAGLLEVDPDEVVLSANASAARLLGTTIEDLVGRPMPQELAAAFEDAAATGSPDGEDLRFEWQPTPTLALSVSVSEPTEASDDGHHGPVVLSLHDVTRERAAAELHRRHTRILEQVHTDLEQVQQIRGDLIDKVSHEIRTPVTVIQGVGELLSSADLSEDRRRELVAALRRQTERLGSCLDSLLRIAESPSSSAAPLTWDPGTADTDIGVLFAQAAERLDVPCLLGGDAARPRLGDEQVRVIADVMLSNARVHGAPPFEVAIEQGPNHVRLDLRDQGDPPAEREHIFDAFVQGTIGDRRTTGGLGLGLPSARRLARLAGGDLVLVEDAATTTFRLTLPLADPATVESRR